MSANIDSNRVREILCEDERYSWRYKIGWATMRNRKNIERLISKIEASFDCHPIAFKSWYYHKRNDNDKQFSAIKTNKDNSEICFRIEPHSFDIEDPRIIHGKRWFFAEGKEKRIRIIPENYDLIMECLRYSFDISNIKSSVVRKKTYTILIAPDKINGGFIGSCGELHAFSQGQTYGEIMENMKEAVELSIQDNMHDYNMLIIQNDR